MKFAIPILISILIAGCTVQIRTGPDFAKVVGVAVVTAGMIEYERERSDPAAQPSPELSPTRSVVEHDCTLPLEGISGNLKCR
ncbi:MAG TPA: hypothetical protein VET51_04430 [Burkholderiales bacterium]|nr:hypothetical protein [Burkholderiales bacterium]